MFNFFGKTHTPEAVAEKSKQQAREWQRQLKRDIRQIDKQIRQIEVEEKKAMTEIKSLAAKKEVRSVTILAKEVSRARKGKDRLLESKAQMNSVIMSLQQQVSTMRMSDALKNSTEVMQKMGKLISLPEFTETMQNMAKEMEAAGVIDSVVGDAIESLDAPDTEEETQKEVAKVLEELALDVSAILPSAAQGSLAQKGAVRQPQQQQPQKQAMAMGEEDELERRLRNL